MKRASQGKARASDVQNVQSRIRKSLAACLITRLHARTKNLHLLHLPGGKDARKMSEAVPADPAWDMVRHSPLQQTSSHRTAMSSSQITALILHVQAVQSRVWDSDVGLLPGRRWLRRARAVCGDDLGAQHDNACDAAFPNDVQMQRLAQPSAACGTASCAPAIMCQSPDAAT